MASQREQSESSSTEVIRHPSGALSALAGGKGSAAAARGRAVYAEMHDVPRSVHFEQRSEKTCADLKACPESCSAGWKHAGSAQEQDEGATGGHRD